MRQTGWGLILAVSLHLAAAGDEYADRRSCATCHPKIADSYKRTGMGRSIFRPSPANTLEDYQKRNQFLHSRSGTYYAMTTRGDGYFQRRWEIGFDGKESNV